MPKFTAAIIQALTIFFAAVPAVAADQNAAAALTPADVLESHLPNDCYHAGDYQQAKAVQGLSAPLRTSGSFVFNCTEGLIWHTQTPIVETVVYTKEGEHWHLNEQGQRVALEGRVQRTLGDILNNLIGGNDQYILKNFELTPQDQGFSLTPKSRRLSKFLQSIELEQADGEAMLTLFHPREEFTQITISDRQVFESINQQTCDALGTVPPAACQALLQ